MRRASPHTYRWSLAAVLGSSAVVFGAALGLWAASIQYTGGGQLPGISSMRRARPVIAIVTNNAGTEITDFMIPRAILAESGVAEVVTVAPVVGRVHLFPGSLSVDPDMTIGAFDASHPHRADYIIVPAIFPGAHDPEIASWLRRQAANGSMIIGICDGVPTLAAAGLLEGHRATGHWASLPGLAKKYPGTQWVWDKRYVIEAGIITTTGVSASMPVSLVLVERIAGRRVAADVARRIGVATWDSTHDSHAFAPTDSMKRLMARHSDRDEIAVSVADGVDEIALGLTVDAISRPAAAVALADSATMVVGKQGLHIYVERRDASSGRLSREVRLAAESVLPAQVLDAVLSQLAVWYGQVWADLIAIQMEYPRPVAQ